MYTQYNKSNDWFSTNGGKAFASSDLYPQSEPEGAEMKAQTARRQTAKHNMGISNGTFPNFVWGIQAKF